MIYHSSSQDVCYWFAKERHCLGAVLHNVLKVKGRHFIPSIYHCHNSAFNPTLITFEIQFLENQQSPSAELEQEQPFANPLRLTRQQ